MGFAGWSDDYTTSYLIPTSTYRIWTDRINTNLSLLQMYDDVPGTTTNFNITTSGLSSPSAGYYVGGIDPNLTTGRNFGGDICEIVVYKGALSDPDRLTVLNYLEEKYFNINGTALSFQWLLNGTDIPGATNAILSFPTIQATNAGNYSVVVTNAAGAVTSSVAILTVAVPPFFYTQPQSQSNGIGSSVTFSASAGGNLPIRYQWQFDGINITNATNTSLTIANIQTTNAGTYRLVATNASGSLASSNAVLTVLTSRIQVVNSSAVGSTTASVPIQLISAGDENTLNFSLTFNNMVLTYSGATLGSNASGAFLFANTAQANSGRIGLELELPGSSTFSIGTQQVILVNFVVAAATNASITPITFGTQPTVEEVLNSQFTALPATYSSGNLSIAATAWEGDVSPRTNGDQQITINDWVQEGRFITGLDTVSNANEFQRADCAPRATEGDGRLTVADWVQVGRYAEGLDTPEAIGGPSAPAGTNSNVASSSRVISLSPLVQNQTAGSVSVQMTAQGNENAVGFSINFDPAVITFAGASLGSGASSALMDVNTNQTANGVLGIGVALTPGDTFEAGSQQLVQLTFSSVLYSNNATLSFGDAPVSRQVADTNAAVLPISFENGTLSLSGAAWPSLGVSGTGTNIVLSWPALASALELQMATSLGTNWSNIVATPTVIGSNLTLTLPILTNTEYFRLKH
jgi:hypothetical protein